MHLQHCSALHLSLIPRIILSLGAIQKRGKKEKIDSKAFNDQHEVKVILEEKLH